MVEVKRKDGESAESMLRRFSRKVQQSGLIIRAKKAQHYSKEKPRDAQREDAVWRAKIRAKMDYLRKIGKLEDPAPRGRSQGLRRA